VAAAAPVTRVDTGQPIEAGAKLTGSVRADKVTVAGEKRSCGRISQEKGRATCPAFARMTAKLSPVRVTATSPTR